MKTSRSLQLFVLAVGVFSILNTEMGVVGILPAVSQRYGVGLTDAGLLVSLFALAIAVAGPVLPMLLSRFDRKRLMVGILALFAACNVAAAFAPTFGALLAARVVPAFFHPVFVSFALAAAADCTDRPSDVPRAVSRIMVGVSAGMVLGAPVAGLVADWASLRASLLFFAAVNVAGLVSTVLFVPRLSSPTGGSYRSQLGILKQGRLWLALAGVFLLNGSIFGVYSYVSSYLGEVLLLPAQVVSGVLLAYGLMNVVGNTVAGRALSSRPNRFVCLQPVLVAVIYALMLAVGGATLPACTLVLLWGVAAGFVANTIQYWVSSAAPGAPEFANGLYLTAANLGVSAATPFCGAFITGLGTQAAPIGGIALAAGAGVCALLKVRADRRRAAGLPTKGSEEGQGTQRSHTA